MTNHSVIASLALGCVYSQLRSSLTPPRSNLGVPEKRDVDSLMLGSGVLSTSYAVVSSQ
ncbi:MAG: hypothetical protein ACRCYY_14125 [Trueperaceae bacterium]